MEIYFDGIDASTVIAMCPRHIRVARVAFLNTNNLTITPWQKRRLEEKTRLTKMIWKRKIQRH
jgi:hypothetical protein